MKDKRAVETIYQKKDMGYAWSTAWKVQIWIAHTAVESLIIE